ncbi:hypothetical protein TWF696_008549 [Orbilia brochopaga]|uniref:Uncharacterized protein n=1 Tax=Orbilia brochopaga TaxID=3140254 RepID=A0AAV9UH61_9PEZI
MKSDYRFNKLRGLRNEVLRDEIVEKTILPPKNRDLEKQPIYMQPERIRHEQPLCERFGPEGMLAGKRIKKIYDDRDLKIPWPTSRRRWRKHWRGYLFWGFILLIALTMPVIFLGPLSNTKGYPTAEMWNGTYIDGVWVYEADYKK